MVQASHWRLEMVTMVYSNCKGLLVLNRILGPWLDSDTRMALQRKPVPKRGIWSKPGNVFCQIWKIYMGEIGWAGWPLFQKRLDWRCDGFCITWLKNPNCWEMREDFKISQPSVLPTFQNLSWSIFLHANLWRSTQLKKVTHTDRSDPTHIFFNLCTHYPATQNASHHQDDMTFLAYKPLFATVTRCIIDPMYTSHISNPKKNLGLFFVHKKKTRHRQRLQLFPELVVFQLP